MAYVQTTTHTKLAVPPTGSGYWVRLNRYPRIVDYLLYMIEERE